MEEASGKAWWGLKEVLCLGRRFSGRPLKSFRYGNVSSGLGVHSKSLFQSSVLSLCSWGFSLKFQKILIFFFHAPGCWSQVTLKLPRPCSSAESFALKGSEMKGTDRKPNLFIIF